MVAAPQISTGPEEEGNGTSTATQLAAGGPNPAVESPVAHRSHLELAKASNAIQGADGHSHNSDRADNSQLEKMISGSTGRDGGRGGGRGETSSLTDVANEEPAPHNGNGCVGATTKSENTANALPTSTARLSARERILQHMRSSTSNCRSDRGVISTCCGLEQDAYGKNSERERQKDETAEQENDKGVGEGDNVDVVDSAATAFEVGGGGGREGGGACLPACMRTCGGVQNVDDSLSPIVLCGRCLRGWQNFTRKK